MPVMCPNPHCNHVGPLKDFGLQYSEKDVYQCSACGRSILTDVGEALPNCCGQDAKPVGRRAWDLARCPKCRAVSMVVGAALSGVQ